MRELEYLLSTYLTINERDHNIFKDTLAYILKNGIGASHLEEITQRNFLETEQTFLLRCIKEIKKNPQHFHSAARTLLTWYESWRDSFPKITDKNRKQMFQTKPYHTWLYSLLNGQYPQYLTETGQSLVVIAEKDYRQLLKNEKKPASTVPEETNNNKDRFFKLLEIDQEFQLKYQLFGTRIAIYHESYWSEEVLIEWFNAYHFDKIDQYSAVDGANAYGNYDYILFLTKRAQHDTQYQLESRYGKNKVYLLSRTNTSEVLKEWITQLNGNEALTHD